MMTVLLSSVAAYAEKPIFSASLSKNNIEVGDRFEYIIDIEADRAAQFQTPTYGDTLSQEQRKELQARKRKISSFTDYNENVLEVLEEYPMDTIKVDGRRIFLRKRYLFAAMETGNIDMRPALLYLDKNREKPDTLYSPDSLILSVKRYEALDTTYFLEPAQASMLMMQPSQQGPVVDSLLMAQHLDTDGITSQKDMPFVLAEITDYIIYGIIALIILGFVVWFVVWRIRKRRQNVTVVAGPQLPPHVVANKALEALNHRKLWQNGKIKLYYTELTDILRIYIFGRWGISAMELTTDEIIAALKDIEMPRESRMELVEILRSADMVKFAKAMPEAKENEDNFTRAYYFVENTKHIDLEHNEGKTDITIDTKINE